MDQPTLLLQILLTLIHLSASASGVESTTFTLLNKCDYAVWPGILSNAGVAPLQTTGFALQTGESKTITVPTSWGGRFWGRTLCAQDSAGKFSCVTGDCGSGKLECAGSGATPPATLAEFTLHGAGGLDFFDVSLVDGYNLPILVAPQGGSGDNCTATGCVGDLNGACPSELKVMSVDAKRGVVACKSACDAFRLPQYCCSGAFGSPNACKPSSYSAVFKSACPRAYSYAYDDKTSTFTCASADYIITFCPSPDNSPSKKSSQAQNSNPDGSNSSSSSSSFSSPPSASSPPQLGGMVYVGALDQSEISWSTCAHVGVSKAIASVVSIISGIWLLCQLY